MLNEYAQGHEERAFVKVETTDGTNFGVVPAIATGDHVRLHGSFGIGRKEQRRVSNDKRANAAPVESQKGDAFTEWALGEGNARPPGALSAEPEFGALWYALLGAKHVANANSAVQAVPAPTVSGATVADAASFFVGDLVRFSNGAGTGAHGLVRRIASKAANALTWEPALPAAPAAADVLKSGANYTCVADPQVSLAMVRYLKHTAGVYAGLWVNEGSLKFSRADDLVAAFSGQGMGKGGRIGSTKLAGGINNLVTVLNVTANEGPQSDAELGWYFTIDTEVFQLVSIAGAAWTVLRAQQASAAAAHLDLAEITPWVPTPTYTGRSLSGLLAYILIVDPVDGVQRAISLENAEVKISNGFKPRREAGNGFAIGFLRGEPVRQVTVNMALPYKRLTNLLLDAARKKRQIGVVLRVGEDEGYIYAAVLPRVELDPEGLPDAPEAGDTMITLTGSAFASSNSAEDQITIGTL